MKTVEFTDVSGDFILVKADKIDALVKADHDVPAELDEHGNPVGEEKVKKFFLAVNLSNGRQVVEKFDDAESRDARFNSVVERMVS